MKRGEIWTAAARGPYTGKPRPVVIVQDDLFDATTSVTVCAFTTDPTEAPLLRIPIEPDDRNGLSQRSSIMADKITTILRSNVHTRIGRLSDEDLLQLGPAMIVFLGLASSVA